MSNLQDITPIRFFSGDKAKRAKYIRSFRDRWGNDSHFVRSACIFFMHHLDDELRQLDKEKRVRR